MSSLIDLLMLAKPEQGKAIMSSFEQKYRDWHTKMSYIKSALRLLASGIALWFYTDVTAALVILAGGYAVAEIIGILEEII